MLTTGCPELRRGRELERFFCGFSSGLAFHQNGRRPPDWLNFRESIKDCLANQPAKVAVFGKNRLKKGDEPWNPFRPPTLPASRFLYWIRKWMPHGERGRVGLYVALGRSLDQWHSVDLLIVGWPRSVNQPRRMVTVDLTSRQNKVDYKTDLQLHPWRIDYEMSLIGRSIAHFLLGRINKRELRRQLQSWHHH